MTGVPVLSIGAILGDSDSYNMSWSREIRALTKRIMVARESFDGPFRLNVVFFVDGKLGRNDFQGVRTGRFDRKDSHLMVQAAIPAGSVSDHQEVLWALLEKAVEAAAIHVKDERISVGLSEIRDVMELAAVQLD